MQYSVVILSYNKLPQLPTVVEALKQPQIGELILCDDCSDDGTVNWAENCGKFNKIWVKKEHTNYALNTLRNQGVSICSFPNIVFLDGDCVPETSLFSGHDNVFRCFPEVVSVGFTIYYDSEGKNILKKDGRIPSDGISLVELKWKECFGGNMAFTKSIWEKVGGFDEKFNGYWGFEDLDFAYRASLFGVKFYASRQTVAKHLDHSLKIHEHRHPRGRNYYLLREKHGPII